MLDDRRYRLLDIFGMVFVAVLILSNIMAQKLFVLGPFVFTTAIIVFPISYILGDVLTEVYGYARTRRIIWIGFACTAAMAVLIEIAVLLPPAPTWKNQAEFETVLRQVPQIVLASLLAYLAGEFTNSYVLARMKILTSGRHLWTRTIGSTVVGQAVDTVVFVVVGFLGVLPFGVMWSIIWSAYLFKVAYEIIVTPLTYIVVRHVKRVEGIDHFDTATNFTPFSLKAE